jgi:tetratricopeptide (TPR) repeat protein
MRCRPVDKLGNLLAGCCPIGGEFSVDELTVVRSPLGLPAAGALVVGAVLAATALSADIDKGEQLFRAGKYAECVELATEEIADSLWDEQWHWLKARAEIAQGRYPQAQDTLDSALELYPFSLQLRLLARTAYRYNGQPARAAAMLGEIERHVSAAPRRYGAAGDRVALGKFLLERHADPRQVLELIYDPLRKESPEFVDVYLATAELALDKYDNALAAETLRAAPKSAENDPQYHYLLARAYASDEPERAEAALEAALAINPRHVESLLFQVDHLIDAEDYQRAEEVLKAVLDVNSQHPIAWAYKAVLAHLANDTNAEIVAREEALSTWQTNPEVDHLIGRKLSEKYRFAEGAEYQRRALALEADYRPAKLQLSQDLLRLGEEEAGWRLADEVARQDAYDVVVYNLVTLRKEVAKFRTLDSGDGLIVRMDAREAELYGDRVLELLRRARAVLCKKYNVKLEEPIVIEIFPHQKDFAVRTFGMPGVSGFLGVCFGRVITANSPASQGERPSNWEATLWHEFCHVVTLHKTRNKMPRWLSEGISVYEEREANPTWGQSMTPEYREIVLSGKMTPVSRLSSAFLAPPSPLHLQFAYYESSLVVEHIVSKYGQDALASILTDLGDGMDINLSLLRHTAPLGRLDDEFAEFARRRAEGLAPTASWDPLELPAGANAATIGEFVEQNPQSVPGLQLLARQLLRERKFAEAIEVANQLRELFADEAAKTDALRFLAAAHRGLSDTAAEQQVLEELAARDADASDAYLRLMQLTAEQEEWSAVAKNARRMLAVNPLVVAPHRYLAQAAEKLGERDTAVRAYRALLAFETTDPVETRFRLAKLLDESGEREPAKRQVLMALEEAPRFLEAHRLLLKLTADESGEVASDVDDDSNDDTPADAAGNDDLDSEKSEEAITQ